MISVFLLHAIIMITILTIVIIIIIITCYYYTTIIISIIYHYDYISYYHRVGNHNQRLPKRSLVWSPTQQGVVQLGAPTIQAHRGTSDGCLRTSVGQNANRLVI